MLLYTVSLANQSYGELRHQERRKAFTSIIVYQSSMIFKVVILSAPFPTTVIQSIFFVSKSSIFRIPSHLHGCRRSNSMELCSSAGSVIKFTASCLVLCNVGSITDIYSNSRKIYDDGRSIGSSMPSLGSLLDNQVKCCFDKLTFKPLSIIYCSKTENWVGAFACYATAPVGQETA